MPGRINHDGYILLNERENPLSYSNGTILEHRLIWQEYHKACLLPCGTVHHINKDKTDNRIENLFAVMNSKHVSQHMRERFKNYISIGLKRKCSVCGTVTVYFDVRKRYYIWKRNPLNKSELLCNTCYQRIRRMNKLPRKTVHTQRMEDV